MWYETDVLNPSSHARYQGMNRPTFIADSSNKPLLRSPLFKGLVAGCLNGEPQADHHDESTFVGDKILIEFEKIPGCLDQSEPS